MHNGLMVFRAPLTGSKMAVDPLGSAVRERRDASEKCAGSHRFLDVPTARRHATSCEEGAPDNLPAGLLPVQWRGGRRVGGTPTRTLTIERPV